MLNRIAPLLGIGGMVGMLIFNSSFATDKVVSNPIADYFVFCQTEKTPVFFNDGLDFGNQSNGDEAGIEKEEEVLDAMLCLIGVDKNILKVDKDTEAYFKITGKQVRVGFQQRF